MRYCKSSTGRRKPAAAGPRQGGHYGVSTEADAQEDLNAKWAPEMPELALAAAVLEDALRIAKAGHPADYMDQDGSRLGMRYAEHVERYTEALDWLEAWAPNLEGFSVCNVADWLGIDHDVLKRAAAEAINEGAMRTSKTNGGRNND